MTPATLITGASAGIGAEFARLLGAEGETLVITARRQDRLEALAGELRRAHGVRVETVALDLARNEAADLLAEKVQTLGVEIHTLINNAGFGLMGAFAEQPLERITDMLALNVVALTRLTGVFLAPMRARRVGGIINVASTASFLPGPYMSVYYASKAYVLSFSEAIAHELRGSGVVVTALCPGPTPTEFQQVAGMAETPLLRRLSISSREVARLGLAGHRAGKTLVIPGLGNKLTPLAPRLLPRGVMARIVARLQKQRA
ncbi:MAG: SDR family oxidoreductase [Hyphomicrobiales bacterium]|nr:SDR family oxidoreductase [Hyphomicrobiales bacterium]MBV9976984.1 SDR family oxidoreductase [Hyphomicrobiales bacterium]